MIVKPLISIIVPVYNTETYLEKCITSILEQTYHTIELILVDDGSSDRCGEICDEYAEKDPRVRLIHKENEGQAIARNVGLKVAQGDYITFVDSDDWLDLKLYETVMQRAPFDIALFGCTYVDEKSGDLAVNPIPTEKQELNWNCNVEEIENIIRGSLFGYAWNRVYSKEVLQNLEMPVVHLREDLLFSIEVCSRRECITVVNCVGYYYNQRAESTLKKNYVGQVPDIAGLAVRLSRVHPLLTKKDNRRIANYLMKTYICDAVYKYVFMNCTLSEKERIASLNQIFSNMHIKKIFCFYYNENRLFFLLTLCMKLKSPWLFYRLVKEKWHLESSH